MLKYCTLIIMCKSEWVRNNAGVNGTFTLNGTCGMPDAVSERRSFTNYDINLLRVPAAKAQKYLKSETNEYNKTNEYIVYGFYLLSPYKKLILLRVGSL